MDNFKLYNEEKNEAKLAELWPAYLALLSQHGVGNPILSKSIESALNIKGACVRALLNYGLRQGVLVSSSGDGYFICNSRAQAYPYLHHIRERMIALQTHIRLSESIINGMPLEAEDKPFESEDLWDVEDILRESGI